MRTLHALSTMLLLGCSSTGTVETSVSSNSLTSLHGRFEGEAHLTVTIREVAIHQASDDQVNDNQPQGDQPTEEADDASWTTVFSGPTQIDLYDTGLVAKMLGSSPAPAGKVTQVRLILDDDPTLTVDGVAYPVSCPSCTNTGLKLVPHGTLEVPEGGTLMLSLDFDQDASLEPDSHGGFTLRPTVHL